jgi:hypothetical protein
MNFSKLGRRGYLYIKRMTIITTFRIKPGRKLEKLVRLRRNARIGLSYTRFPARAADEPVTT